MRNIKNIIFDLDGTLYPNSARVEDEVRAKVGQFVNRRLGLYGDEAQKMLTKWFETYDGSVNGIKNFPAVTQAEFMEYICDVPLLGVKPNPELSKQLEQLPQRVYIFTDSTHTHVRDTLAKIGITRNFDGVFTSQDGNFVMKSHLEAYAKMLGHFGLEAGQSVFIDDNSHNIANAEKAGMKTIFISEGGEESAYTPYSFSTINEAIKLFV